MIGASERRSAMRNIALTVGLAVAIAYAGTLRITATRDDAGATGSDQVHSDFQQRVQQYVDLHRALERTGPPIQVSDDWAEIKGRVDALANRIRDARRDARRGDIFSPAIEHWFRRAIADCLEGIDTQLLIASLSEEDAGDFVLLPQVNGRWPEGAPLMSMPAHLLEVLPPLPQELQYRLMNRDLLLWDAHVNVIVDFIEGALP
jgi:hypothetical protein